MCQLPYFGDGRGRVSNDHEMFNLESAKQTEAHRRSRILGRLIDEPYSYNRFEERFWETQVPVNVLRQWHSAYCHGGEAALLPEWEELPDALWQRVLELREGLAPYVDKDPITPYDIADYAACRQFSMRSAGRWIQRYCIGGLWGLTPKYNPLKPSKQSGMERLLPSKEAATDAQLEEVIRRHDCIEPLLQKKNLTEADVIKRAEETGISRATLYSYLSAFRRHGFSGLMPKVRSDAGTTRLDPATVELITNIRLTYKDAAPSAVHERAVTKTNNLGLRPPSIRHVRSILKNIDPVLRLIADGRTDDFVSSYQFTGRMEFEGVVYQIDHTLVDVLVLPRHSTGKRRPSIGKRPWLTTVIDSRSRLIIATQLGFDTPNRHRVAAVLRDSILAERGGIPDQVWVDNGKDLISKHVQVMTKELGIHLHICSPHHAKERAIVERLHGTYITGLWSRLPGYTDSNTKDRNPSARAELTLQELEDRLNEFVAKYNHSTHSTLGVTPAEFWDRNCFARKVFDIHQLDLLLYEVKSCVVLKDGIHLGKRIYVDDALGDIISQSVMLRADMRHGMPDTVEVYRNSRWLCRACASDTEEGRKFLRERVGVIQKRQLANAKARIEAATQALQSGDETAAGMKNEGLRLTDIPVTSSSGGVVPTVSKKSRAESMAKQSKKSTKKANIFDLMEF